MLPTLIRHGTLYVMWSCASTRVPFIELSRTPYLSELDFGWLRVHIKIDWRPKGWNEAEWQARLARWGGNLAIYLEVAEMNAGPTL
jgi:hypothetical protein